MNKALVIVLILSWSAFVQAEFVANEVKQEPSSANESTGIKQDASIDGEGSNKEIVVCGNDGIQLPIQYGNKNEPGTIQYNGRTYFVSSVFSADGKNATVVFNTDYRKKLNTLKCTLISTFR